jgi:hypothetical protein
MRMKLISTDEKRKRYAAIAVTVLLFCCYAHGQVTLHGTATNGTTRKPVSGEEVLLLRPDKGMAEEARTRTNARGEFTFALPDTQSMRAVRIRHNNVNYHQAVFPGSTSVGVTVYESAQNVLGVRQADQSMVIQAKSDAVQVFHIFNVANDSQPPQTQPNFSFYLPEGAKIEGGQAIRAGAMPLKSTPVPVDGEKNKYVFMYPLIPGQTHFEVIYTVPYTGTLKIEPKFVGPVDRFYVIIPTSMRFSPISASVYQSDPQRIADFGLKEMDAHVASSTEEPTKLAFEIAGEGVLQEAQSQPGGGQGSEDNRPGGGLGVPNARPNPLASGQWGFLVILTIFMAIGVLLLFYTSTHSKPAVVAQANSGSNPLLEGLKEEMFQLEADKIHGKIANDEYNLAKAALDKTLQRAMKRSSR